MFESLLNESGPTSAEVEIAGETVTLTAPVGKDALDLAADFTAIGATLMPERSNLLYDVSLKWFHRLGNHGLTVDQCATVLAKTGSALDVFTAIDGFVGNSEDTNADDPFLADN